MNLFHLSDDPGIVRFEPRLSDYTAAPVVWAIGADRVANYLTPRDCPRVCFRAGPQTTGVDAERFLGDDKAVVAIETGWRERFSNGRLYRYVMPPEDFVIEDAGAGYWVAHAPVLPLGVEAVEDLAGAVAAEGVTLRLLPSLWELYDAVKASSLVFSMIRMRNAARR